MGDTLGDRLASLQAHNQIFGVFLDAYQTPPIRVKFSLPFLLSLFLLLTPNAGGNGLPSTVTSTFCLFKNPLCFYNLDVLRYMQVLHQKQEYTQMAKFFYGPVKQQLGEQQLAASLADVDFGYSLKRVGIKEIDTKNWSLTYQRTILGTQENFKLEAALINDTCKVYLDEKTWGRLFAFK